MAELFGVFHFLRPWWLITLVPLALVWWGVRRQKTRDDPLTEGIAPHLARALTVGLDQGRKVYPIDGVALTLALLALAAAGPTWSRVANPLLAQTAPLAVVLKVTPSMENVDVQPTRLKRASFKILDLIERRAGAKTALIAYAGSAHRVTPLTEDPNILKTYLSGLAPDMMPLEGARADQALALATTELEGSETPGAILFVLDDLSPGNVTAFNASAPDRPPVIFFVVGGSSVDLPQLNQIGNSSVVNITADDADLSRIEREVLSAYREALLEDTQQDWEDRGWILAWVALLLFLPWFRRGWTMRWALATLLVGSVSTPAQAEGWKDWFLTPDQQGQIAMNNKEFSSAAELFQNPEQRAFALLRSGRYEEAAEAFGFIETAAGATGEGVALLRSRKYRDGIRAFEKALERDPDDTTAAANLEVARAIVEYVENAQLSSDTGEEAGIGADDTVFDNETGQGEETEVEREETETPAQGLSTEDWMRAVDTDVGDFLATRFLLENSQRSD